MPKATQPATSGIGWSSGTAAQVSLPSMLSLRPLGRAGADFVHRSGARRQRLRDDLMEKVRLDRRIGERSDIPALLGKILVALRGQRCGGAFAVLVDPEGKAVERQCFYLELHIREAVATEMARHAEECAGLVSIQV